jgi:hypothetical protein
VKVTSIHDCTHTGFLYGFDASEIEEYLLFASATGVRGIPLGSMNPNHEEAIIPVADNKAMRPNYVAVDYDAVEDFIYYSEVRKDIIWRIRPNGTGKDKTQRMRIQCLVPVFFVKTKNTLWPRIFVLLKEFPSTVFQEFSTLPTMSLALSRLFKWTTSRIDET